MGAELSICRPSALVEATVLTPTRASAPFTRFQVVLGSLTSVRLVRRWGRLSTLYRQCCPKLGSQAPWRWAGPSLPWPWVIFSPACDKITHDHVLLILRDLFKR